MGRSHKKTIIMLAYVVFVGIALLATAALAQDKPAEVDAVAVNSQVEALINAGRQALKAGDDAAAMRIYQELLRSEPDSAEALFQLAFIYFRKGDQVKGLELMRHAAAVAPVQNPLPRLALAKALVRNGRGDEAVQEYEKALSNMAPDSPYVDQASLDMNLLRLKLAAENRDRDKVLEVARYLMERHVGNIKMLDMVASTYVRASLFEEAKLAYERLLEQTPDNPVVAIYLAGVYEKLRQPKMAIKYYEQALEVATADDLGLVRAARIKMGVLKAFALAREGDNEGAYAEFQKVLALEENNVIANMNVAAYFLSKKDYAAAERAYQRVLSVQPDNLDARYRLGLIFLETSDVMNAVRELDFIVARSPDSRVGQASQKTLDKVAKRWNVIDIRAVLADEAALIVRLKNNPEDAVALIEMGDLLIRQKRRAEAVKYYEQAIAVADDSGTERDAKIKMGILKAFTHGQEGDKEGAYAEFQKVLVLGENNVIANMNVAAYLLGNKDYAAAKQAYQRSLKAQPDNLDARYRLALIFLETSDVMNAVRELDFIVARSPESRIGQASKKTFEKVAKRWNLSVVRDLLAEEAALNSRLEINPEDAVALTEMGDLLIKLKRRDEAVKLFEEAMRIDPEYAEAYLKAGLIYEDVREFEKAVDAYQAALAVGPDSELKERLNLRLLVAGANLDLKNNKPKQAEQKFISANQMSADELPILWGLAVSIAQQGDMERAVVEYLKIVDKYPRYYQARMSVGFIYERLEEEALAIAQYQAVALAQEASPALKKRAEDRVDYLQRQINGLSYAVGYSLGFDDNLNSAREQKYFEYRSDLYAGVNYRYKLRKGVKLSVNVSPSYSIYHRAQFDFFNFSVSPTLLLAKWGYDWNFGVVQNTQSSVLRPEQSSTVTQTLTAGASWRNEAQVGYRANMSYRGFGSSANPFFDADTVTVGISRNHAGPNNAYMSYGYSLTMNNSRNILGNDYSYVGHGVNGRIDKRLDESLSAYVDSRASLNMYQNGDSATNFQRFRRTFSFGFGGGINYQVDSWVSLYADYHLSIQYSNLPVGFIFNELQSVEGRQSTSLGSFGKNSVNVGMRMNF